MQPVSDAPVNGISTCVKGKFGWDFVNSEDRITKPLIRQGDTFVEASWEEALEVVASICSILNQNMEVMHLDLFLLRK